MKQDKNILKNAVIFITGGTGSWGNELTRQLLKNYFPKEIRIYSRGEHKQVEMKRRFQDKRVKFIIGDVREKNNLMLSTRGVDYIFHLAALKHVPVCEYNPWEAVATNIVGTQNLVEAAIANNVKKVVDVSTDKAVDPFNLYGVTKACGEKLIIAGNILSKTTKFVCVRGGNVLGTNGSVIPLFKEQLAKSNEITLTDPKMTRFLMRVEEAIELVLHATTSSVGGEVFVMKMSSCKMADLAKVMIARLGNKKAKVKVIGIRPGEKLYEVLVSKYEVPRTYDFGRYYVVLPQINIPLNARYYRQIKAKHINQEFNSNNATMMTEKDIARVLEMDGWFNAGINKEALNYLKSLSKKDLINFVKSEDWV